MIHRRHLLLQALVCPFVTHRTVVAMQKSPLDRAAEVLENSVQSGLVKAATMVAQRGNLSIERAFGECDLDSPFLLGSISKPICITPVLGLIDRGVLSPDHLVKDYIAEFRGGQREFVTLKHLLTHVSGLPDQLPENALLRSSHAPLKKFVEKACEVDLHFTPGERYEYSSMGILLACEIAQRVTGRELLDLVNNSVLKPLAMNRSALGVGSLPFEELIPVQTERAAIESGGGDESAKSWDWNSKYWRELGAPWGCVHASAKDVKAFLEAFDPDARHDLLSPKTRALALQNHNPPGFTPRGLGFALGKGGLCVECSSAAYGHTGSTGTIAWRDPQNQTACVILTSLPAQAVRLHPRDLASAALNS